MMGEKDMAHRHQYVGRREAVAWALAALSLCGLLLRGHCPYVWHGGAPGGEPRGSCWIGATDSYAMCTPSLAIDLVIEHEEGVMLVRRSDNGKYATMGGFIDVGESPHEAVERELKEETALDLSEAPLLLGVYGDPRRDKRRHTVSVAYVRDFVFLSHASSQIARTRGQPKPGSDARGIEVVAFDRLNAIDLAFDHRLILDDYLKHRTALLSRRSKIEDQQRLETTTTAGLERDSCLEGLEQAKARMKNSPPP